MMPCIFYQKKLKISKKKRQGVISAFLKKAGCHQKGAGRHALQKRPRQNTDYEDVATQLTNG